MVQISFSTLAKTAAKTILLHKSFLKYLWCSFTNSCFFSASRVFWRCCVWLQPFQERRSVRDAPKIWETFLIVSGEMETKAQTCCWNKISYKNCCTSSHYFTCGEPKYIVFSHSSQSLFLTSDQLLCVRLLCTQHGFTQTKDKHFI